MPGIDCAYLAMDTEEGVEVVWNEVRFSERKNLKAQEEKIRQVFDNLTQLEHPNIVKFHKYWMETNTDKPRVCIRRRKKSCNIILFPTHVCCSSRWCSLRSTCLLGL